MSDREKKLVLLFGLAAFLLVNFFGISWFQGQKAKIARQLVEAKGKVDLALVTSDSYDTVIEEMDWLNQKTPEPRTGQLVGTELEQYASNQATTHQLTITRRDIKANDESGVYFHRAMVEFRVNGREDSFYRWLDRLQMPEQFRAVTFLRLAPDTKEETLIDATVHVEQWYVPLLEGDAAAAPVEEPEAVAEPAPVPPAPGLPPGLPPEALNPPGTE